MIDGRPLTEEPALTPELLAGLRSMTPQLMERIVVDVQENVAPYAGPVTGKRRRLIDLAAHGAATQFFDRLHDRRPSPKVDQLYRQMGYGEAVDGHELVHTQNALDIAARLAWTEIRRVAIDLDATAEALGILDETLRRGIDYLSDQFRIGHRTGIRVVDSDPGLRRNRLVGQVLSGGPLSELVATADRAGWDLPSSIVIIEVEPRDGAAIPDLDHLGDRVLCAHDGDSATLVCPQPESTTLLERLRREHTLLRAAVSWPVPMAQAPAARGWARRALDLRRRGVIRDAPSIACADHYTQLWLHGEPLLRQRLVQQLMPPLLAETPNSREILAETMLAWLESRDSAPAIATRLGVHPQTIRYRWKRINGLFGELLQDPEFVIQVTMLLKASVPLWKNGDQSDFERFNTEESA